ncbi:enoyl-CoA hydratase/isomerase family protein [Amantichitinum ursilacus]|uniref:Putative enoyl-CoA hydratase echA17 n=1 Tax=Amantichitinum ursilacus TaxID=857265 RepID=A0A0N0GR29_9NEIS|nr:enoyl-CoA hydratase/isomerase family protein [Amantichitinum ursilacus]KPC55291.1 putative enoyl-CoA hydratase echA17 [Amantichitinum ursilacus]
MLEIIEHDGAIRELRMARPPVNALNPALIREIRQQILAAPQQGVRALILSGAPGLFSAGLDVPALLALDTAGLEAAFDDFFGIFAALAHCPVPVVAAITGHSPAGGAVMSIFCDYRVMAEGDFRIGLNEVQVGLVAPDCVQIGLRRLVGPYRAERLLVSGSMIPAAQAHQYGMVDELAAVEGVVPAALRWLQALDKLPRAAMLATRAIARADIRAVYANGQVPDLTDFVTQWFAESTQASLQALVARLKK